MKIQQRNQYILCTAGRHPVELDVFQHKDPFEDVFLAYWIKVFQFLEADTRINEMIFYIVWDYQRIRDLPTYGENVVAVLLMDEFCAVPHYIKKIKHVYKAYGFFPWMSITRRGKSLSYYLKYSKDISNWLTHYSRFICRNGLIQVPKNKTVLPLGYARQRDVPVRPFADRKYMISFLGSLEYEDYGKLSLRKLLGTPKYISRLKMKMMIESIKYRLTDDVYFGSTNSFMGSILSDGDEYTNIMAETKICLSPRGSSVETYRFFEGMRHGCIVVCDRLPRHWFYDGCPAIQVDDWEELPGVISKLMRNPAGMLELHSKSMSWWEMKCSEEAVSAEISRPLVEKYNRSIVASATAVSRKDSPLG